MLCLAHRQRVLLRQRNRIERIALIVEQSGQQFFLSGCKTREIAITDEIGGVMGSLTEVDAESDLVNQTRAAQKLPTSIVQLPVLDQLLCEIVRQRADAPRLLGIKKIALLQIMQGAGADILPDGQMQHGTAPFS